MTENNNSCCPPAENPAKPPGVAESCCPPASSEQSCCSQELITVSCCPPKEVTACCPPRESQAEIAGYSIYPFVICWLETPIGKVPQVSTQLDWADRRGSWAMRWGIGREHYQVTPGIYAVGQPDKKSPLLVSANYKLSFDCLRAALSGINAWILVIDTKGINVWCAAGKGTFGTDEIIRRCKATKLEQLVSHRQLIVPQLGAPGVAAYKVKQETGFSVIYGPVRASDLKAFIRDNLQATAKMRQATFSIWERLILTPVEVTVLRKPIFISILLLFVLSGIGADIFSFSSAWQRGLAAVTAGITGVISGCVLTPILLPWLPTRAFAAKGALLGLISATVLYLGPYRAAELSGAVSLYLLVIAVSSYTAMNFTGSTTFTSPSGVEKEMRIAIPCQVLALLVAGLLWIGAAF